MPYFYACFLFVAFLFIAPPLSFPATTVNLEKDILFQQDELERRQRRMNRLTNQEKKLQKKFSSVKQQIKVLSQSIAQMEQELHAIKTKENEVRKVYKELTRWKHTLVQELEQLLILLWPLHGQRIGGTLQCVDSWNEMDRHFTWLSHIYQATSTRFKETVHASKLIEQNIEEQSVLAQLAEEKLDEVNKQKDALLQKKLHLWNSLRQTQNKKDDLEKDLQAIIQVIKDLNYKLQTQYVRRFEDNRLILPWPVKGRVTSTFAPYAKPARRGIGIAANENTTVKSIFWGKVMHADTLRGFGQVVIVYHGNNYYSVYAYLSKCLVLPGREIEKDEPLGVVGFDPKTKQHGLYFELRFGSKPINPMGWLSNVETHKN